MSCEGYLVQANQSDEIISNPIDLEIYDRPTDQPTKRPTEVTLQYLNKIKYSFGQRFEST